MIFTQPFVYNYGKLRISIKIKKTLAKIRDGDETAYSKIELF